GARSGGRARRIPSSRRKLRLQDAFVQNQAPLIHRGAHRASGLCKVPAVAEPAARGGLCELAEAAGDGAGVKAREAELGYAGSVDDRTGTIELVQPRGGGGLATRREETGDLLDVNLGVRDKGLQQRRLSHAR